MNIFKRQYSYLSLTIIVAIYFTVVMNVPFYSELYNVLAQLDGVNIGFVISVPFFLLFVFIIVFSIFSLPVVYKPLLIFIVITSSMVSYATYNYRIFFDQDMLVNVLETHPAEAQSYLSIASLLWVLLLGIAPAIFIFKTKVKAEASWLWFVVKKIATIAVAMLGIAVIALFFYKDYASIGRNNRFLQKTIIPTYYLKNTYQLVKDRYFSEPIEYKRLGLDAKQIDNNSDKPTLLVFLVGETARVQNQQYYGYVRPTNQYTEVYSPIYFNDVASCGTATATSLPCMFSVMTRKNFERNIEDNQDNALDIMQRAGVDISWLENDGGDKNVAQNIDDMVKIKGDSNNNLCNGKTCFDEIFLDLLDERLVDLGVADRVIFLHLIGSHGPTYFQRYPRDMAEYLPDCQRADIENCSKEAIVNTYDNTLNYTDYVIAEVIDKLSQVQDYNTAVMYLSDHGESLGENGIYLHGLPYNLAPETQTKVPMLMWFSKSLAEDKSLDIDCLKSQAMTKTYSHDNLFHSLLGLMNISTKLYQSDNDIFTDCRN